MYFIPGLNGQLPQLVQIPPNIAQQNPNNNLQFPGQPPQQQQQNQAPAAPTVFVEDAKPTIRGCIKIEGSSDPLPEYRVLFDGKETMSNAEGFFSFPLENTPEKKYRLVICKEIKQHFDKFNTLKSMSLSPALTYNYFSLKKNNWTGGWDTKEKKLTKRNYVVPEHSVVVLIAPKYIERVDVWTAQLPANSIKLPCIVLKKNIDHKKLARASAKSLLKSLDSTSFHEPVVQANKKAENNTKINISLAR